ncbi:hypothetical protein RHEC894_PD00380 (plasmid) [Rhizobium sp. CIAT894]|uniref:hypothetical protein n=1 Tax=Rhizobium sp. CIAT894 TaxID=2020312 RepID=UPI000A1FA44C|nr:hypothetical protein [Rhizobium sp. CIAT894]ARM91885.1 hypothetical protein RHEC894_PD00380 [Rhizobium sp. CIAT894]
MLQPGEHPGHGEQPHAYRPVVSDQFAIVGLIIVLKSTLMVNAASPTLIFLFTMKSRPSMPAEIGSGRSPQKFEIGN